MKKLSLSLVVITKNEERNIERCLRSVPFADDVVVVDSESSDETCRIAESLGARVFVEPWRGFGPQKKFAVEQAKHDWILSLDADEALSPELSQELQDVFENLNPQSGYLMPRKSYHLGKWILHGGWYPDEQLRLFHRQYSNWNTGAIHEKVEVSFRAKLRHPIFHWVFEDLSHQVITNDRYSNLQSKELYSKGYRFSLWKLVSKPPVKFLECYFFKRGFLDGMPGLIIAVGAAYSVFLKWAKLWELEKIKRK